MVFVDERATPDQEGALLRLFTGQLGGARRGPGRPHRRGRRGRADAHQLHRRGRQGPAQIGALVEAEMAPFVGATGNPTTLAETVFSTIPGLARVRRQGQQVHARRERPRHPERGPRGPQRPAGPLPLRRLTAADGTPPMFAAAHLRRPRRDRAILAGSLVALVDRRLGLAVAVGGVAVPGLPRPCRRRRSPAPRGGPVQPRLGADDRRDDAALEHPAGHDLPGARRPAPAARPRSSGCSCSATSSCGPPSGSGPGSWIGASTPASRRSRPWPSSPSSSWPRPCPSPACGNSARSATAAWTSAAVRWGSSSTAGAGTAERRESLADGHRPWRVLRRLLLVADARHVRRRPRQRDGHARPRRGHRHREEPALGSPPAPARSASCSSSPRSVVIA